MMLKTSFGLKWTALRLFWCIIMIPPRIINVAQVENERSPARMLNDVSQSSPKIVVKQWLVHQVPGLAPCPNSSQTFSYSGSASRTSQCPKALSTIEPMCYKNLTTPISKYRMKPSFHRSNGERLATCRTSSWRLFTCGQSPSLRPSGVKSTFSMPPKS